MAGKDRQTIDFPTTLNGLNLDDHTKPLLPIPEFNKVWKRSLDPEAFEDVPRQGPGFDSPVPIRS